MLGRFITLHRPECLKGLHWCGDSWVPAYELGDLRAYILGVRVPILWALNRMVADGTLRPPQEAR